MPQDFQDQKTQHPGKIAASMAYSPNLAAKASGLTKSQCREIRDKQESRRRCRWTDPLLMARSRRLYHFSEAGKRSAARLEAEQIALIETERALKVEAQRRSAVRETLIRGARIARQMGFLVTASRARNGRVSSYYLGEDRMIRLSDHAIPATALREARAFARGEFCYNGWGGGVEIILEGWRSDTWLRRRLLLARAGR